ncbi:hypothetical protein CFELI_11730 [Corynebacterium felinum]|nr:hypothetical protein CFELI_11730 [Corynebacterium felinum]
MHPFFASSHRWRCRRFEKSCECMNLTKHCTRAWVAILSALMLAFVGLTVPGHAHAQSLGEQVRITTSDDLEGHSILINDDSTAFRTRLFGIDSGEIRLSYCVEPYVEIFLDGQSTFESWDKFPGNNNFKHDKATREKINWIVANSYPTVDTATLAAAIGVSPSALSVRSAIAQTQAAIWTLAEPHFKYGGFYRPADQGGRPNLPTAEEYAAERALYDYLLGPANEGRPESTNHSVKVTFDTTAATVNKERGVVGPYTVVSNTDAFTISSENAHFVTEQGEAIDAATLKNGSTFYLKITEKKGNVKVRATAHADSINGAIIVTHKGGKHGQTVIVTHSKKISDSADMTAEWEGIDGTLKTVANGGDARLPHTGGEIIDKVKYNGLFIGREYTVKGWLMERGENGEAIETGIKSEVKFTPESSDGTVDVKFTVPEGYEGKTLVVFEEAYNAEGELVAEHKDINDKSQTVTISRNIFGSAEGNAGLIIGAVVLGGAVLVGAGLAAQQAQAAPLKAEFTAPAVEASPAAVTPAPAATKGVAKEPAQVMPPTQAAQLANTGVGSVALALLIAVIAVVIGGLLVARGRRS